MSVPGQPQGRVPLEPCQTIAPHTHTHTERIQETTPQKNRQGNHLWNILLSGCGGNANVPQGVLLRAWGSTGRVFPRLFIGSDTYIIQGPHELEKDVGGLDSGWLANNMATRY